MNAAYLLTEREGAIIDAVRDWDAQHNRPVPFSLIALSVSIPMGENYLRLALRDLCINGWLRQVEGGYRDGGWR